MLSSGSLCKHGLGCELCKPFNLKMDYVDAGGTGDQGITLDDPLASQIHRVWLWHACCGQEDDEQYSFRGSLPRSRAREVGVAFELPPKFMGFTTIVSCFCTAFPGFVVKEEEGGVGALRALR